MLDLKESAQGGSGPHGLCVGATGSGKSELLRTLVLGLAATHSPLELNLVLVDFKGGATFLDFTPLPHVSAVITNLADELALVDRMAAALTGEIHRRQELLRAAGNLTGIADYAAARRAGAELPPLPALLVVVDEFAELLAQRPELIELLVTIGRIGRSLGMHLLLASQRLDEGRMRGLESHLSYRIALRTFSAADSRAALGVPDAHRLGAPGSAILAAGSDELVRFQASYVSGPSAHSAATAPRERPRARRLPGWPTDTPARSGDDRTAGAGSSHRPAAELPTVLSQMIDAMAGLGPPAHRVWIPPLDLPPALDEVLGPLTATPERGLSAADGSPLRVPIGLVDRPLDQRREAARASTSPGRPVTWPWSAGRARASRRALVRRRTRARGDQHPGRAGGTHLRLRWWGVGGAGRAAARRHHRRRPATRSGAPSCSPSSARYWPGGNGCSGRPASPRSPSSGLAVRPATSPTSRPPTCCWSSTATSPCAATTTTSRRS